MAVLRKIFGTSIAIAVALTVIEPSSAFAQAGGAAPSAPAQFIEKLTRVGNEIHYDMTIEDPDSFIEPWVMPTRILRQGGGDGIIPERAYCEV